MYIQDRLKTFKKALEDEFSAHSMFSKDELFGHFDPKTFILEGEPKLRNRIQSMYLFWLLMMVEKMEEYPQFKFVSTIEGVLKAPIRNIGLEEIENMMVDFLKGDGIFSSTGGGVSFPYNNWYNGGCGQVDIATEIKLLCMDYAKSFGTFMAFKVGQLANQVLRDVLQTSPKVTPNDIIDLQDKKVCKSIFGVNYPVLVDVNGNYEKRRYYSAPIVINGKSYKMTNDWYERNLKPLEGWIKAHQ